VQWESAAALIYYDREVFPYGGDYVDLHPLSAPQLAPAKTMNGQNIWLNLPPVSCHVPPLSHIPPVPKMTTPSPHPHLTNNPTDVYLSGIFTPGPTVIRGWSRQGKFRIVVRSSVNGNLHKQLHRTHDEWRGGWRKWVCHSWQTGCFPALVNAPRVGHRTRSHIIISIVFPYLPHNEQSLAYDKENIEPINQISPFHACVKSSY